MPRLISISVLIGNVTHCITVFPYRPVYPDSVERLVQSDCHIQAYGTLRRNAVITCISCIAKRQVR